MATLSTESLTSLPKSFADPTIQLKGRTARIMFIHWTFFLSCGPTQNENKVQKKTLYARFLNFQFLAVQGWAYSL